MAYGRLITRSAWSRCRDVNPVPTRPLADDITTAPSGLVLTIDIKSSTLYEIVAISRSSQCSTTGVTKAVVCVILSVGWCI